MPGHVCVYAWYAMQCDWRGRVSWVYARCVCRRRVVVEGSCRRRRCGEALAWYVGASVSQAVRGEVACVVDVRNLCLEKICACCGRGRGRGRGVCISPVIHVRASTAPSTATGRRGGGRRRRDVSGMSMCGVWAVWLGGGEASPRSRHAGKKLSTMPSPTVPRTATNLPATLLSMAEGLRTRYPYA